MTIRDRASAFAAKFHDRPASHPWVVRESGRDVLYAVWLGGQDYRNRSRFHGAYPHGYLERVEALFPDVLRNPRRRPTDLLHVFSGSLPEGEYERCDMVQPAEHACSVYDLPNRILNWRPRLILADPPYTKDDATKYGTPMVDRRRAIAALARVTNPGAFLVWLDITWPLHSKREWVTVGRIFLERSTGHRTRSVHIFERVA